LRKGRFPSRRKSKLMVRRDEVKENAYKIELLSEMNIFATFNVGDLTHYIEDLDEAHEDFRATPLQQGEIDAEQPTQGNLLNHIKAIV